MTLEPPTTTDDESPIQPPSDSETDGPETHSSGSGAPEAIGDDVVIATRDLSVSYGDVQALQPTTMDILEKKVTAIIGPSGCGKSTFLRCINRMNDLVTAAIVEGELYFRGKNVYDDAVDPVALRRAALWDEVKDQLDGSGLDLSGGQQQRLCIARAIAPDPEVVLMDEPASALDPIATSQIEDLLSELAEDYIVVIVTHNMQQAARISDRTAVFLTGGELVEFGDTDTIFADPDNQRVEDYITGKFG